MPAEKHPLQHSCLVLVGLLRCLVQWVQSFKKHLNWIARHKKSKKRINKRQKKKKTRKNEFTPDVQNAADRCQSKQESMTDHRIQNAADFKQSKQYTKREVKRMNINGSQPRQLPCWLALLCLMCLPAQAASSCTESPVACTRPSPLEAPRVRRLAVG